MTRQPRRNYTSGSGGPSNTSRFTFAAPTPYRAQTSIGHIALYNGRRPYASLDRTTPYEAYFRCVDADPGSDITKAKIHLTNPRRLFGPNHSTKDIAEIVRDATRQSFELRCASRQTNKV